MIDTFAVLQPLPRMMYEDEEMIHAFAEEIWTAYLALAVADRLPGPLRVQRTRRVLMAGEDPWEVEDYGMVRISGPAESRKPVEPAPARGRVPGRPEAPRGS